MKEAFEKIKERLEELINEPRCLHEYDDCCDGLNEAIKIVSEVEAEYGNGKTNADNIRSMSDEELAEFFACFITICEMCIHINENCMTMSDERCREGILQWLKSEVKE
jgi:hypothetical protein